MATDQELVKQVRSGEREAYAELYRKYYDRVYLICLSIVKNPQDAEELAQEMFVRAYFRLDQLRNPARFFPWLRKMTHNRSRNYAQRTKTKIIQIPFSETRRKSAPPDDELLRQEVMDSIMEAIEALPARDREVIQARIDGLNHAEISERFGISVKASMTRLYRARRKLASHLKGLCGIFGLLRTLQFTKVISGGVAAMKVGISTKVIIGVVGIFVAGFIGFNAIQRPSEVEPNKAIMEQQATNSAVKHEHVSETDARSSDVKADAQMEANEVSEKGADDFLARLDEIDEDTAVEDVDAEAQEAAEQDLELERRRQARLEYAAKAAAKVPGLVEEWKQVMARRDNLDSIYGAPPSEAKNKEFMRLQTRRWEIANEIQLAAILYDHLHPEEGVISYPDGWMGRAAAEVGVFIGNDHLQWSAYNRSLKASNW